MSLTAPLSEGVVYYVRVNPATADFTDTGTVTWASSPRLFPLLLDVLVVGTTPAWMRVSVANGDPLDQVSFWVDGGATIWELTLDEDGSAVNTSIPLPALAVGEHVLTVATSTTSTTATFTVTDETAAYPDEPDADLDAVAVIQTGVVRWVLQDPTTGHTNFIFPINPHKMSSPHAARVFTTEHSTAPDGQALTFEGAPVGVDWSIEGTVRTQGFHDALEGFLATPRRLHLIDHLSRAWTVSLESIAWSRLPEAYNDWAFTYVLKAIIYAGPRQL